MTMSDNAIFVIFLLLYIIAIIYFVILGCYMLSQRGNPLSTRGELIAKLRMTRTMAVAMFIWAFELFLYLPPMLWGCTPDHPIYELLFFIMLILSTPMVYTVMFAIMQRQVNQFKWGIALCFPYFVLVIWYVLAPSVAKYTPIYIAAALCVASVLFLLIRFASEYRIYIRRLKSEYSEITRREIFWSWNCFFGFAMQFLVFAVYEMIWSPTAEVLYLTLSIINASGLCFCICRQHTIDVDVVPDVEPEVKIVDKTEEKAFYVDIEQKLKTLCEDKLLFLDPDLTRETLCLRLAINRTYLSMYLRHCGSSYYQYINTLRIEYAVKLMQENPDLSINEICDQSGYRTQTTFRRAFQEVMGCLPSEVKCRTSVE